mgnify:FL=1
MIAYLYICFVIDQVGIFKEYLKNYQNDNSERINTIFIHDSALAILWRQYGLWTVGYDYPDIYY